MATWVIVLVIVIVLLVLIGIGIGVYYYYTYDKGCASTSDCAVDFLCANGKCVKPSCRTSADCPPELPICNGVCTAAPPCTGQNDCTVPGEVCNPSSRRCVQPKGVQTIAEVRCDFVSDTVPGLTDDTLEVAKAYFPSNLSVGSYVVVTVCSSVSGNIRPAKNWYAEATAIPSDFSADYITVRKMADAVFGDVYRDLQRNQSYAITGFTSRGQAIFTPT
jgi:hypothetical protein